MVTFQHVDAGYGKVMKIQDISVTFPAGQLSVVVGPNGSGKSTLLKAMMGICNVGKGKVMLGSRELLQLSGKDRARKIAYLPQNRNTPSITAYRMVLHGRFPYLSYPRHYSHDDHRLAMEAMERMGIASLAGETLLHLSGGERQKVYLAMALAGQAECLVLDEPSNFLDVKYQRELMLELKKMTATGKAVIAVLHDINAAFCYADQIVVLDSGRIAGAGTVQEIYEGKIVQQVFGIEIRRFMDGEKEMYYVC